MALSIIDGAVELVVGDRDTRAAGAPAAASPRSRATSATTAARLPPALSPPIAIAARGRRRPRRRAAATHSPRGDAVVGRAGELRLGREAVVDRHDDRADRVGRAGGTSWSCVSRLPVTQPPPWNHTTIGSPVAALGRNTRTGMSPAGPGIVAVVDGVHGVLRDRAGSSCAAIIAARAALGRGVGRERRGRTSASSCRSSSRRPDAAACRYLVVGREPRPARANARPRCETACFSAARHLRKRAAVALDRHEHRVVAEAALARAASPRSRPRPRRAPRPRGRRASARSRPSRTGRCAASGYTPSSSRSSFVDVVGVGRVARPRSAPSTRRARRSSASTSSPVSSAIASSPSASASARRLDPRVLLERARRSPRRRAPSASAGSAATDAAMRSGASSRNAIVVVRLDRVRDERRVGVRRRRSRRSRGPCRRCWVARTNGSGSARHHARGVGRLGDHLLLRGDDLGDARPRRGRAARRARRA